MAKTDVLIVGGGLIGLGIGWQLAKSGWSVTVIDRDPPGAPPTAASWVAAGMLAPLSEAGFEEPDLLELGRASLDLYPRWIAELEAEVGEPLDYRTEGTLLVALDRDDAAWLRRQYEFQQRLGLATEWLDGDAAREREPFLSPATVAAVSSPGDHGVDSRRMWGALRRALSRAGGNVREGAEAVRIEHGDGHVRGVWVRRPEDGGGGEEMIETTHVVVCAGAWTRLLMKTDLPPSAVPPIRPVKGQLIELDMSSLLTLSANTRSPRVYLVPKGDGRLVVGATSEERGFDTQLTAGGLLDLLRDAWEMVPGIYDLAVCGMWAGLRPASRDNAPILGATPIEGLFVATGHFRNGVLLTPVTAYRMLDLLVHGRVSEDIKPFALDRFFT